MEEQRAQLKIYNKHKGRQKNKKKKKQRTNGTNRKLASKRGDLNPTTSIITLNVPNGRESAILDF